MNPQRSILELPEAMFVGVTVVLNRSTLDGTF